jgi:soluble lytic murein transglycosylase-like protein
MLVSGLGLLIADHAGTLILSFQKAAAPRAIEWVELESSYSNPNSFDPHDIQAVGLPGFAPEVRRWSASIERWSKSYELPPLLIAIVMQIESCGDAHAQSSAGARGLFQVMPFHFESGENSYEPETNARRGLAYLRGAYDIGGGKIDLALAGYNGGHTQIGRDPSHWPEETRRYVVWGTGIWEDLVNGASSSPTLAAWLDAGGARLCQSALASVDDR